jgi:hypothetical protein
MGFFIWVIPEKKSNQKVLQSKDRDQLEITKKVLAIFAFSPFLLSHSFGV